MGLEEVLPNLSENEQYLPSTEAGKILRKMHAIELDVRNVSKETKRNKEVNAAIEI